MLKCNRCGIRDELESALNPDPAQISLIGIFSHENPMKVLAGKPHWGWGIERNALPIDNRAFATCLECTLDALDFLEEFYGGSEK